MGCISVYGEIKSYCYGLYMRLWENKVILLWAVYTFMEKQSPTIMGSIMRLWRNKVLLLRADAPLFVVLLKDIHDDHDELIRDLNEVDRASLRSTCSLRSYLSGGRG
jgi:hypothetical protein